MRVRKGHSQRTIKKVTKTLSERTEETVRVRENDRDRVRAPVVAFLAQANWITSINGSTKMSKSITLITLMKFGYKPGNISDSQSPAVNCNWFHSVAFLYQMLENAKVGCKLFHVCLISVWRLLAGFESTL